MDSITTTTILDRGAKYLGNHPDHLTRRLCLAQILVDARIVRSVEAGVLAFRMWAVPESRNHPLEAIFTIAEAKARERQ